jgi:hypothetical protein
MSDEMKLCTECGSEVHWLAVFPGGKCLACHAANSEGRQMWTAEQLTAAWGGKRTVARAGK